MLALFRVLLALSIVLTLAACGGADGDDGEDTSSASSPSAPEISTVEITLTDDSIELSQDVEAEPTQLVARNEGEQPHQVYLARLNDGVTEAEIGETLEAGDQDALFQMIVIAGSFPGEGKNFGRVSPGRTGELTIDFPEGSYMVIDPEVEGPPPYAVFDVVPATGAEALAPEADYEAEVGDFYFEFGEVTAGPATVEIANVGEQGHEISIGTDIESEEGEEGAFTFAPPPGGSLWTTFELEPGSYDVVCFLPDPKTGKTHNELGMKTQLEVN